MRGIRIVALSGLMLGIAGSALAQTPATSFNFPPGISFPMCDATRTDQCLQLGQNDDLDRRVNQLYPKCAKLGNPKSKGACVNAAMAKH